jgi:hypothetical protein
VAALISQAISPLWANNVGKGSEAGRHSGRRPTVADLELGDRSLIGPRPRQGPARRPPLGAAPYRCCAPAGPASETVLQLTVNRRSEDASRAGATVRSRSGAHIASPRVSTPWVCGETSRGLRAVFFHYRFELCAVILVAMSAFLRLLLISRLWPALDSDEATMGLMALHIAHHHDYPLLLYGQAYMGAIEAYVAAIFFAVAGPSLIGLRLGLIILFALFLCSTYLLAYLLYSRSVALASVAVLSVGSADVFSRQLQAVGGYDELLVLGSVVFLLTSWLVLSDVPARRTHERRRREIAYGALGLAAGLGLWSDFLFAPILVTSGIAILVFCRDELRSRAGAMLAAAFVIGLLPLIVYNVQVAPNHSSVAALSNVFQTGGTGHSSSYGSLLDHVVATISVSLPLVLGSSALYPLFPQSVPLGFGLRPDHVLPLYVIWGCAALALWLWAFTQTCRAIRRPISLGDTHSRPPAETGDLHRETEVRRHTLRLLLLGTAGIVFLAYLLSTAPAVAPRSTIRYLIPLWICTPAVLAPLFPSSPTRSGRPRLLARIIAVIAVGGLCLAFLRATITVLTVGTPLAQQSNLTDQALIHDLLRRHIFDVYSDYWTCDRLIFQSDERILCSVLNGSLGSGYNRFTPYQRNVRHALRRSFVFPRDSSQAAVIGRSFTGLSTGRVVLLDGYVISDVATGFEP